jgi:hypothetical protein
MRLSKMKMITGCCVLLLAGLLISPAISYSEEIEIDIAPNVLNLQSSGTVVTVHTDIAYWAVNVHSVFLNDVYIQSWKADNQGNFVAKFSMDAVKELPELIIGDYNTLTIIGADTDGEAFVGEQEIKVIDVIPQGR